MEEILASIRRIISEDEAPEDANAEPAAEEEAADESMAAAAEEAPEADDDDVLELTETYDAPPAAAVSIGDIEAYDPEPEPEPAPAPVAAAPRAAPKGEALVSPHTESFAASSFGSLTSALLVPHSDRTLEDVTRDLLRPLLQAWLDENLPAIVENQVRQEVERIARQSRR